MKRTSLFLLTSIVFCQCTQSSDNVQFKSLLPEYTGIDFSNNISYGDTLSVLDFEYMYNGAGVAIADFNNDGYQDIFFAANQVSCKLYLNKGNLQFQDVTSTSGIGTTSWVNGVSIADINQDGWKDIYLSVGGNRNTPEKNRANLLFINNQNLTFSEKAKEYGLDDKGYAIQSAFFDYDLDGDLDVYVLRNSFVNYSRNNAKPKAINGEARSNDRLFRNNGNQTFTDVTREAGILIEGFGLGVNICDLNEDGWPDVYVSNDFITNDLIWINNQNGTFTNKAKNHLKHQTFNGMGNDVADFNNDGLTDILVLDMLPEDNKRWKLTPRGNSYDEFENGLKVGYEPQYVRNTLQLNNGNGSFSEIGQMAGIEATEWSWASLFADFDNDGWKDIFITNGYGKDITNLDFIVYGSPSQNMGLPAPDKKERQRLLNELPGIAIHNYMYRNTGSLIFQDVSNEWGFSDMTYSNGAAYGDLDNDGDLDLAINNINQPASIMENRLEAKHGLNNKVRLSLKGPIKNRDGFGSKIYVYVKGKMQFQYFNPSRGYLSTVEPIVTFGLGAETLIDSLIVIWPDKKVETLRQVIPGNLILDYKNSVSANQLKKTVTNKTVFKEVSDLKLFFEHKEDYLVDFKIQPAIPHMLSKLGPGLAIGDLNGDGTDDLYIGNARGNGSKLYLQETGRFVSKRFDVDTTADNLGALFFDADNDGDLDLYQVLGGFEKSESSFFQDKLYINDGKASFTLAIDALPKDSSSGSYVIGADFDKDGDVDLFVGGRVVPSSYPIPATSTLLLNESKNGIVKFIDATASIFSDGMINGMITSGLWTDYDNDGWQDLIVVGEFMPITFYKNRNGKLEKKYELPNSSGWWNSLNGADFDSDGDIDYVAGNLGLNSRFKASQKEPMCVYAKDFNGDGRIDPILTHYVDGVKYIAHTRDNLIDQINTMKRRFTSYSAYAEATFEESFTKEEIKDAFSRCAVTFENSIIKNLGNGQFEIIPLPLHAQISTMNGMLIDDINDDGVADVLAVGNSYAAEVINGRYDASIGWVFLGNGDCTFTELPSSKSGFFADGDARSLVKFFNGETDCYVVGNNNQPIRCFASGIARKKVPLLFNDVMVEINYLTGKVMRLELHHGEGYLSAGSNSISVSKKANKVIVVNNKGERRTIQIR